MAALQASAEVIVCEAVLDALTFWRWGFRHVTCAFGIEGFGPDLQAAMAEHGTRRVLVAYDRDDAGDKAAARLADRLTSELGVECFRVQFPRGEDVNSVAVAAANPVDVLGKAIRAATWMGTGDGPSTLRRAVPLPPPAPREAAAAVEAAEEEADGLADPVPAVPSFAAEAAPPDVPLPSGGLLSSPVPAGPSSGTTLEVDVEADELRLRVGDRRWRVRGLAKVSSFDLLRVNVLVTRDSDGSRPAGAGFHVDTLDLYSARARTVFVKQAGDELGLAEDVVKRDLGRVLLACEDAAEQVITAAQTPKSCRSRSRTPHVRTRWSC